MKSRQHFLEVYKRGYYTISTRVKLFLQENLYKISLLILVLFIVAYKDFRFRLDLVSAVSTEEVLMEEKEVIPTPKNPETYGFTELQKESHKSTFSFFPSFLWGSSKKDASLSEGLNGVSNSVKKGFINRFSHVAVEEMKKYGIPASITLGQALLHGQAGSSELAEKHNNLFSITCGSSWQGKTIEMQGVCYRIYPSAWKSFRDHSELITSGRFATLKTLSSTDYKQWALGLAKNGYSVEKDYAQQLIDLIKQHNLDRFDQ